MYSNNVSAMWLHALSHTRHVHATGHDPLSCLVSTRTYVCQQYKKVNMQIWIFMHKFMYCLVQKLNYLYTTCNAIFSTNHVIYGLPGGCGGTGVCVTTGMVVVGSGLGTATEVGAGTSVGAGAAVSILIDEN